MKRHRTLFSRHALKQIWFFNGWLLLPLHVLSGFSGFSMTCGDEARLERYSSNFIASPSPFMVWMSCFHLRSSFFLNVIAVSGILSAWSSRWLLRMLRPCTSVAQFSSTCWSGSRPYFLALIILERLPRFAALFSLGVWTMKYWQW